MIRNISISIFLVGLCYLSYQLYDRTQTQNSEPTKVTSISFQLEKARFLLDLLDFDVAFPLEQRDEALFEIARCAVQTKTGLFIVGDSGDILLRYHLDGSLDKVVANQGDGPGEIGRLEFATRIFNDQVAFWDLFKNQIIVFDENGDFKFSLNFNNHALTNGSWIPVGVAFHWPDPEKVYFSNVQIKDKPEIRSASAQVHWSSDQKIELLELDQTMGTRNLDHESKYSPSGVYDFLKIGNNYWLGSPEFSTIHLYNLHGKSEKIIPISIPDPLTAKHYQDAEPMDSKKMNKLINYHGFVHEIIPLPQLVLAKVGFRGYVPFTTNGKQLLNRRLMSGLAGYKDTYDGTMLFITNKKNINFVESKTGIQLINPDIRQKHDEDYPFAILARLKPELSLHEKI